MYPTKDLEVNRATEERLYRTTVGADGIQVTHYIYDHFKNSESEAVELPEERRRAKDSDLPQVQYVHTDPSEAFRKGDRAMHFKPTTFNKSHDQDP